MSDTNDNTGLDAASGQQVEPGAENEQTPDTPPTAEEEGLLTTEEVNEKAADESAIDEKNKAAYDAYKEATGDGEPTGAEPVTDTDGREVSPQEMPANSIWPGQTGGEREQGAPGQEAADDADELRGSPEDE